jgi:hypothetical protein
MSIISRLTGKPATAAPAPAAEAAAPEPPRPDPVELAREDEARLAAALAGGSPEALSACVLESHSTRARQKAASLVSDPDHLRELIRLTRGGKDNSVYRILTTKRDALLAVDRNRAARRVAVEALVSSLARRSRLPYDPLYEPSLTLFHQDWVGLAADATAAETALVEGYLATMRDVIARHHQSVAEAAERERERDRERQRELAEAAAAAAAEAAAAAAEAAAGDAAAAEPASTPDAVSAAPPAAGPPHATARPLVALLRQAQAALDRGGTARAQSLRTTLADRLDKADKPLVLPPWFERQTQQLDARLAELKDWKTFTVVPKRAELLERMQSLVGATMSPEVLAGHVRKLQEEWRTLQRGATDETSAEAKAFRDAAHRAYEPCREHFARQAALRKANQARREAILARLSAFAATLSADGADLRHVSQTIAEARQEWRDCAPVDNAVAPLLQERLRAALAGLQARLDAEYARNVAAKQDLIGRAQALLQLADVRQAMDEAKALQKHWRDIGPVAREQSNALWDQFRGHCDAVFQRSAREAAAFGAGLAANQARAVALCDEIEGYASLAGEELRTAMQALDARRAEFDALELPRQSARDLRQRFQRAASRCSDAVRHERAATAQRAATVAFEAATAIRGLALAQLRAGDVEAARATAAAAIAGLAGAPKPVRTALEQRLAQVAAGNFVRDLDANENTLRLLCIRAELVADVETPESDRGLRRDYQMRRLVGSRELGADMPLTGLDALALEWFAAGPVEPSVEAVLRERFERCRR